MSLRRPTVARLLFILNKALSAMSPRRPTVARLSFTFQYKPFMWCRLDARLRHDVHLFTFRGVAPDTRLVFHLFLLGFQADYRRFPFTYLAC